MRLPNFDSAASEEFLSISFIVPVYNAGLHIKRCLESIRRQSYPQDKVEIIILDGGSSDDTVSIAAKFDCRIFENRKRLAEYGVQLGMLNTRGELCVTFAADNELAGKDWLMKVTGIFNADSKISAVWGRLASGETDAPLNKYFALIQSDPLNWFLNNNLKKYLAKPLTKINGFTVFKVNPRKPLVWGANGLVYRTNKIKAIWSQEGYLGDNDAFQYMVEQGDSKVAYFDRPFVYHHHVARLDDWAKKWKRNFIQHLADKHQTRNMNWVFTGNFKARLFLWALYSGIPIFSLAHSIYLALRDRNIYWFYHPIANFLQFYTYAFLIISTKEGYNFTKGLFFK